MKRRAISILLVGVAVYLLPVRGLRATDSSTAELITIDSGVATVWTSDGGSFTLDLPAPAYSVDLDSTGQFAALTFGTPLSNALGGVLGEVVLIDLSSLETVGITELPSLSIVTNVAVSPLGGSVSFVINYEDLYTWDIATGQVKLVTPGGVLLDPAYSPSGDDLYFVRVERDFHGEDDKLDNLWYVPTAGENSSISRITSFLEGPDESDWLIMRRPIVTQDGDVYFTQAESNEEQGTADSWRVVVSDSLGTGTLGPVPPQSFLIGVDDTQLLFLVTDEQTGSLDLYAMDVAVTAGETWDAWCAGSNCEVVLEDIEGAAVP